MSDKECLKLWKKINTTLPLDDRGQDREVQIYHDGMLHLQGRFSIEELKSIVRMYETFKVNGCTAIEASKRGSHD